jgi:hypothetical protein
MVIWYVVIYVPAEVKSDSKLDNFRSLLKDHTSETWVYRLVQEVVVVRSSSVISIRQGEEQQKGILRTQILLVLAPQHSYWIYFTKKWKAAHLQTGLYFEILTPAEQWNLQIHLPTEWFRFRGDDWCFLNEGVKTYPMAILRLPTFSVFTSTVYDLIKAFYVMLTPFEECFL